jgi:hypothetical protein
MMKKCLTILAVAACAVSVNAQGTQTEIMKMKTADGQVIRYEVDNVQEITFGSLFHGFDGYFLANGKYFQDYYAGSTTKLSVYKAGEGYDIHISDAIWGEAEFENVSMARGQLSGSGSITVSQQYGGKPYEATISGAMSNPTIDIPSLMQGGTKLTFYLGEVPQSVLVKGTHQGSISVMVGGSFGPYDNSNVTHQITVNADGTINVVVPEYSLEGTQIGDLTLGTYTISNIAYDTEKGAFYRDYKDDGMTFHFNAVSGGTTTMDGDYPFTVGNIEVKKTDSGIRIVNNFQMGKMPFLITSTFTKASTR